jgi:hypothetical protein
VILRSRSLLLSLPRDCSSSLLTTIVEVLLIKVIIVQSRCLNSSCQGVVRRDNSLCCGVCGSLRIFIRQMENSGRERRLHTTKGAHITSAGTLYILFVSAVIKPRGVVCTNKRATTKMSQSTEQNQIKTTPNGGSAESITENKNADDERIGPTSWLGMGGAATTAVDA